MKQTMMVTTESTKMVKPMATVAPNLQRRQVTTQVTHRPRSHTLSIPRVAHQPEEDKGLLPCCTHFLPGENRALGSLCMHLDQSWPRLPHPQEFRPSPSISPLLPHTHLAPHPQQLISRWSRNKGHKPGTVWSEPNSVTGNRLAGGPREEAEVEGRMAPEAEVVKGGQCSRRVES